MEERSIKTHRLNIKTIRILLTYLGLIIPLLCTTLFASHILLDKVRSEEERKIIEQMKNAAVVLSESVVDYHQKCVDLMLSRIFSVPPVLMDVAPVIQQLEYLSDVKLFEGNINEILLYFGSEEYYSSNGTVKPRVYFNNTMILSEKDVNRGLEILSSKEDSVELFHNIANTSYFVYHYYLGQDSYHHERYVDIVLGTNQVAEMLAASIKNEDMILEVQVGAESIYFMNQNNSCRSYREEDVSVFLEYYKVIENNVEGEKDSVFSVSVWYDEDSLMSEMRSIKNTNMLFLSAGVLLSTALCLVFGFVRLNKVHDIIDSIANRKTISGRDKTWLLSEFDYIQVALNNSIKEWDNVKDKNQLYRRVMLQQLFISVVNGVIKEKSQIQTILKTFGAELFEEYYYLCGISVEDKEEMNRLEDLLQYDLHFCTITDKWNHIYVFNEISHMDYDTETRVRFAEKFSVELEKVGIHCERLVVSNVYERIDMASYAFFEVSSMLECERPRKKIVCWDQYMEVQKKSGAFIDNDMLKVLSNAISSKKLEAALDAFEQLYEQAEKLKNKEKRHYGRHMIINAVLLELCSLIDENSQTLIKEIEHIDLSDEEEFKQKMLDLLQKYCVKEKDEFDHILKFVDENYMDYTLSLEQIAEYAGVSKSQMSKRFKTKMGVGYIEYVTNLRMEKARELLATTSIGIKEVFSSVGYIDVVNASKKFKSCYNVTPSVYRCMMQEEGKENEENE